MQTYKVLVAFNDCYGEFPRGLKREFDSIEDFQESCKALEKESIQKNNYGFPFSKVVLVELTLRENETYYIDEHDGLESVKITKKNKLKAKTKIITSFNNQIHTP